jgi:hypothetical protein
MRCGGDKAPILMEEDRKKEIPGAHPRKVVIQLHYKDWQRSEELRPQ